MTTTRKREQEIIDADIRSAETLPTEFYREQKYFDLARERIFARSWQFAFDVTGLPLAGAAKPWEFLPNYVNEPLLFTRDPNEKVHCLSNVCTHRGNLLIDKPCETSTLRCGYHGRRFALDGQYVSAPGFEGALNFPTTRDNLPNAKQEMWGNFVFAAIDPAFAFEELTADMQRRVGWLPFHKMEKEQSFCRDYTINANWALYVENYLEGLHVPFVHPLLATMLDTKDYRHDILKFSNLQIGLATNSEDAFALPESSPEYGDNVAAYYYWLFPNMMFNFYPWGVSINLIMPLAVDKTCVRYITYVYDRSRLGNYTPESIETTEYEDEAIVHQVQRGIQSRLYKRGRYSPSWESNVHHFHSLLATFLSDA